MFLDLHSSPYRLLAAVILCGFMFCQVLSAAPLKPKLVTAELLTDTSAVAPGKPFTVGVRLTVASGWHIYWINPGDSGQATEVEWTLPEGYVASLLQYPLPERIKDAGGLVAYGYTHEVMLLTTITPPIGSVSAAPIKLSGEVTWLVCRSECIPGKATVSLDLPTGKTVDPANIGELDKWRGLVPREAVAGDPLRPMKITPPADPAKGGTLTISFAVKPDLITSTEGLEWFPPPSEAIQFSRPKFELKKSGLVMTADCTVFEGQQAEAGRRESVLAYRTVDGTRKGILIPLEFRPEK